MRGYKTYTPAIGQEFGIVGPDLVEKSDDELKHVLNAKLVEQDAVISFRKENTDGIKLYSKRGDEPKFDLLALDTTTIQ